MGCATSQQAVKSQAQTLLAARELAQDREPGGVGRALEEDGVGIGESLHEEQGIDKHRYCQVSIQHAPGRAPPTDHEGAT